MAGNAASRAYVSPASKNWVLLGFKTEVNRASLDGASAVADQDIRVPVASNQINTLAAMNWQGLQLRQYQSLLSRTWNITHRATIIAEYRPPQVNLASKISGLTGMGIGKLKSTNVNAPTVPSNLLARATSFGRVSAQVTNG